MNNNIKTTDVITIEDSDEFDEDDDLIENEKAKKQKRSD